MKAVVSTFVLASINVVFLVSRWQAQTYIVNLSFSHYNTKSYVLKWMSGAWQIFYWSNLPLNSCHGFILYDTDNINFRCASHKRAEHDTVSWRTEQACIGDGNWNYNYTPLIPLLSLLSHVKSKHHYHTVCPATPPSACQTPVSGIVCRAFSVYAPAGWLAAISQKPGDVSLCEFRPTPPTLTI